MSILKPTYLIILGGPGCGKGTQSKLISQRLKYIHISAGDVLRKQIDKKSKYAELIKNIIVQGKIVPSHITVNLILQQMKHQGWNKNKYLIDGFPRNIQNYTNWNDSTRNILQLQKLIFIDCPEHELLNRVLLRSKNSNRDDDNIRSFEKRMQTFNTQTKQVIGLYKQKAKYKKSIHKQQKL